MVRFKQTAFLVCLRSRFRTSCDFEKKESDLGFSKRIHSIRHIWQIQQQEEDTLDLYIFSTFSVKW